MFTRSKFYSLFSLMRLRNFCLILCYIFVFVLFTGQAILAAEITRATGKVVAQVTRIVIMPFNGVIDEVFVRPGQAVKEGDPLIRYRLQEEDERQLQHELIVGANTEGFKSNLLQLETQLSATEAQRKRAQHLFSSGLASQQALTRLEQDVDSLRLRMKLLESNIKKNEASFASRIKELEHHFGSSLKEGSSLPEYPTLSSPISGHILTLTSGARKGALLSKGQAAISIGKLDPVIIEVPVYEGEVTGIAVGDKAEVLIASLGDKTFTAKVADISWTATDMNVSNPSYYMVELQVPNPDLELKPGFKAVVRFSNKTHSE